MIKNSHCYLSSLSGKPGKMVPSFEKEQQEYNIIISAIDTKTTLEVITEKPNDIYQIMNEKERIHNIIEIDEGCTKAIQVIVDSEFLENTRTYIVHITRLSSKLAFIETIIVHPGKLTPSFSSHIYHYKCHVGAHITTFKIYFEVPDNKCSLFVNREEPQLSYELNMGCTSFNIKVQSVDETLSKKYLIDVYRKEIPRYIYILDPAKRLKYEDPISLSPLYCPVKIIDYDIWSGMSSTIYNQIKELQRVGFGKSLFEPKPYTIKLDKDLEKRLTELVGTIPLTYGGFSPDHALSNIGQSLSKCQEPSPFLPWKFNKLAAFSETFKSVPKWQEQLTLHHVSDIEKDFDEMYEETMIEYFFYLPNCPISNDFEFPNEANPIRKLQIMLSTVAVELKFYSRNSDLHLSLAYLLEEKFMISDTMNIKFDLTTDENIISKYQFQINNICCRHEYPPTPTLCQQLRMLKDEHNNLLHKSRLVEADKVQLLYEWRSKEGSEEGRMAMQISDITTTLGKAAYKYATALSLDINSCVKNYQVARMLILEGKYGEAIIRLQHALTIDSQHHPSKFLLGLAYSKLLKLTEQKFERAIELLLDGMEMAISRFSMNAVTITESKKVSKKLMAEDDNFFRVENPFICRGILALGRLLAKRSGADMYIKPLYVFHTALQIASLGWANISAGSIMAQFEFVIIECHNELLNLIDEEMNEIPPEFIIKRLEWLNAFISGSILPPSEHLIITHENVCQQLVFHQPCNEYYVLNLGIVLLQKSELFQFKHPSYYEQIEEAINLLKVAVNLNGKPTVGPPVEPLNDLVWFKSFRIKYLTKRAPLVIAESLKPIENEPQGSLYRISHIERPMKKNKKGHYKHESKLKLSIGSVGLNDGISENIIIAKKPTRKSCTKKGLRKKNTINILSIDLKVKKNYIGDETSLFVFCDNNPIIDKSKEILDPQNASPAGSQVNPPTIFSRLYLARAYRQKEQHMESIKSYNFIRKVAQFPALRTMINCEMIEVLLECNNFEQALDLMSKIHINENKATVEDIILCKRILDLLIKMNMYEDERILKYCIILSKHEGLDSIREILISNKLHHIYRMIGVKYFSQDSVI